MLDFNNGAALSKSGVFSNFFHRQDRSTGNVVSIENLHGFEFRQRHGPSLDAIEDRLEMEQPHRGCGVGLFIDPALLADDPADRRPC